MITQVSEDYLKAIFHNQEGDSVVGTKKIAQTLKVSSAAVTKMLQRLEKLNLVTYSSYQGAGLTEEGRQIALNIIRRHRLLELYLSEKLGYSWDEVHEEAERLEHHISEKFEKAIDAILGYPDFDPHGDPIPNEKGEFPVPNCQSLTDLSLSDQAKIHQVPNKDPSLLQYLASLDLIPGKKIRLLKRAPFHGPLTIQVGKKKQVLGYEVGKQIRVIPC